MVATFGMGGVSHTDAATFTNTFSKWERSAKTGEAHAGRKRKSSKVGTVESINGTELTVITSDSSTYAVDASKATVMKGSASTTPYIISVAGIHVGDRVVVRGKIAGTAIAAKSILDEAL